MKVKHFIEKAGSDHCELRIRYRKRGSSKYKLVKLKDDREAILDATVVTIYCEPEAVTIYCYERRKRGSKKRG